MFTSKDLKKLIIPLIFEQLLAVSVGFVDTFMVSIAGEAAVSGVALVDNISNLLIQILSALATGGAVVCSQYLGSRNINMSKKSAGQLIFIMSTLSSLLMVISLIGNHGIINFIFGKIEKDVFESASIYFYITAISYPFLGVYNAGAALFRSIGNSKISMNTSLIMNIINICGNALFIFVFDMGVAGTQGLDFRKRQCGFIYIITGAYRRFRSHDLADEFLLVLHRLPEVCVEGPLGHIAVNMDQRVLVALALDPPFSLCQISGPPGAVQIVKCHQQILHVGPGPHLLGGA